MADYYIHILGVTLEVTDWGWVVRIGGVALPITHRGSLPVTDRGGGGMYRGWGARTGGRGTYRGCCPADHPLRAGGTYWGWGYIPGVLPCRSVASRSPPQRRISWRQPSRPWNEAEWAGVQPAWSTTLTSSTQQRTHPLTDAWRDGEMERWRDGEMERWRDGEMERWRDGEMERWRDGEMDQLTDAWRDGEMERWRDGEMERWTDGPTDQLTDGWRDGLTDRWTDGAMDQWTYGAMDRQTNGPMDGPMDQWNDGPIERWTDTVIKQLNKQTLIELMNRPTDQSTFDHLTDRLIDRSINRPNNQPTKLPTNDSINQ